MPVTGLFTVLLAALLLIVALPVAWTAPPGLVRMAAAQGVGPHPESLAGRLLVADRTMPDGRFARTVIYMVRHTPDGAMGLILNKPVRRLSATVFASLLSANGTLPSDFLAADIDITVHDGGPVATGRLLVLHDGPWRDPTSIEVADGLVLSGSRALVQAILAGRGPARARLFFGHAGWGPQQLEAELGRAGWLSAPADPAFVFDPDADGQWQRAVDREDIPL